MNEAQRESIDYLLHLGYIEIPNDFLNPYIRLFEKGHLVCKVSVYGVIVPIT